MTISSINVDAETKFCATLGRVIIAWNGVESLFRLLLYKAVGAGGDRTDALIANLGIVAICEALSAIADNYDEPMHRHLKHCGKLFDAERLYRNHYVHDPVIFGHEDTEQKLLFAMTQHTIVRGGALRLHQGSVTEAQLASFLHRIRALNRYGSEIIACLYGIPDSTALSAIEMPPMPNKLELRRLKLIEHKQQLR